MHDNDSRWWRKGCSTVSSARAVPVPRSRVACSTRTEIDVLCAADLFVIPERIEVVLNQDVSTK
jgi:hypothetical protein